MASSIDSIIDLVHPTVSGQHIITADEIWVIFDREIDESSVEDGNFFVTGPDFDTWSGPDLQLFHDRPSIGEEEDILESPGFHGILQGDFTFERIALDSLTTVSSLDTVGSGHLYRTKAILTPDNRLSANTEYQVFITGDADVTDDIDTGISSRTVFDTLASGSNTSTADAIFTGGYSGDVENDVYHITITTEGDVGTSQFRWYRDSDPLSIYGPHRTKRSGVLLSDGVTVSFDEGTYELADSWLVVVKARDVFEGNLLWPFWTGSGNIEDLPDTTSTSVLGDPASSSTGTSTSPFSVISSTPADMATNQEFPNGPFTILVDFSADIDQDSIVSGETVFLDIEPSNGDPVYPASGIFTDLSLSVDDQTLSIVVPSGVLNQNNLVTVTIDEELESIGGDALAADYDFWFTTTYSSLCSSVRKVKLEYGAFLGGVIDDTINLAIFEASLAADHINFGTPSDLSYYNFVKREWVTCKAAEILMVNTIGQGNTLRSKKLGDLEVQYNTQGASDALDRALSCQQNWIDKLVAGGDSKQDPRMFVKGALDPDRPAIGRSWSNDCTGMPAANVKTKAITRRRWTKTFARGASGKRRW